MATSSEQAVANFSDAYAPRDTNGWRNTNSVCEPVLLRGTKSKFQLKCGYLKKKKGGRVAYYFTSDEYWAEHKGQEWPGYYNSVEEAKADALVSYDGGTV